MTSHAKRPAGPVQFTLTMFCNSIAAEEQAHAHASATPAPLAKCLTAAVSTGDDGGPSQPQQLLQQLQQTRGESTSGFEFLDTWHRVSGARAIADSRRMQWSSYVLVLSLLLTSSYSAFVAPPDGE